MALKTLPTGVQRFGFSGLRGVTKPPKPVADPTDPRSVLKTARPQIQQAQPDAVLQAIAIANQQKGADVRGALDLSNDPVLRMLRDYQERARQNTVQPPGHSGVQSDPGSGLPLHLDPNGVGWGTPDLEWWGENPPDADPTRPWQRDRGPRPHYRRDYDPATHMIYGAT